jgi:acetyltransferase-like isoleucine patch superfamily enzyme
VRSGKGAIASARALVTGEVAPYAIVGGNPARPIEPRFAPEQGLALQALARRDWPIERIAACLR